MDAYHIQYACKRKKKHKKIRAGWNVLDNEIHVTPQADSEGGTGGPDPLENHKI